MMNLKRYMGVSVGLLLAFTVIPASAKVNPVRVLEAPRVTVSEQTAVRSSQLVNNVLAVAARTPSNVAYVALADLDSFKGDVAHALSIALTRHSALQGTFSALLNFVNALHSGQDVLRDGLSADEAMNKVAVWMMAAANLNGTPSTVVNVTANSTVEMNSVEAANYFNRLGLGPQTREAELKLDGIKELLSGAYLVGYLRGDQSEGALDGAAVQGMMDILTTFIAQIALENKTTAEAAMVAVNDNQAEELHACGVQVSAAGTR